MAYSSIRGAAWNIGTTMEFPDARSAIQFEDTHTFFEDTHTLEELSGEQCLT
jgi:hypothetical protein